MAKTSFTVYHETGSLRAGTIKFHKYSGFTTKARAIKKACALSKKTKGFVGVMKGGIEVAVCHRGKRK